MNCELHSGGSQQRAAGFSLIEVIIASTLLSMMILAVTTLAQSGAEAQDFARRLNRVTEVTQDVVDRMRLELVSSVRLFGNDAEGNGNLAKLDLVGAPTPLSGMRLPTITASGDIGPDTVGLQITGNGLFFAKLAWSDRFACTSGRDYLVDVYRWVHYYQTPEAGGPVSGNPIGLNFVRVLSEPLVDGSAIDNISDLADQAEVLLHLLGGTADAFGVTHDPCEVVWLRGSDPTATGTFRQIDGSDGSLSDTPIGTRPDPWSVLRNEPTVNGMLSYRHQSVATNYSIPSFGVGKFSVMTTTGAGFPHGFEVQVVGPSSARQVLLHLVLASTNRRGQVAWSNMQVVIDARDL